MKGQPATNSPGLAEALDHARARYADHNRQSGARFERAQAVMPGGNTRTVLHFEPFPLYMRSSQDAWLEDVDGHVYLDVLGDYTAGLYGHSDPQILEQISRVASGGLSTGAPGEHEIAFAEQICARFPSVKRVRFCNSGTEANLYALTLARAVTGRPGVLAFSGAYHGGVLGFPTGPGAMNVPFDWTIARYNDLAAANRIRELGGSLAAVIVEPMMTNGGCIVADPDFLRALREATRETGVILVFDEVVTSRMGAGGLQGEFDIAPDLTTFGKYLGAGFSFGAYGGRADLMARFDPRHAQRLDHAGTFNNNVFSMAVGSYGLDRIFTGARAARFRDEGTGLRQRLEQAAAHLPQVQFTGYGSVMNIHFVDGAIRSPEDLAGQNGMLLDLFHLDLLDAGVYAARRGQISLSLPMNESHFDRIVEAVSGALEHRRHIIETEVPAA